jgi:hypothetical protein
MLTFCFLHTECSTISGQRARRQHRPLLLFSTDTGDAWILEPADALACRLPVGGDPMEIFSTKPKASYAIGWQRHYRIDGETFTCEDRASHRHTVIAGYPVQLLPSAKLFAREGTDRMQNFKRVWLAFSGRPSKPCYLPIQNRLKISPSKSSAENAPVISPRALCASRSSSANRSNGGGSAFTCACASTR